MEDAHLSPVQRDDDGCEIGSDKPTPSSSRACHMTPTPSPSLASTRRTLQPVSQSCLRLAALRWEELNRYEPHPDATGYNAAVWGASSLATSSASATGLGPLVRDAWSSVLADGLKADSVHFVFRAATTAKQTPADDVKAGESETTHPKQEDDSVGSVSESLPQSESNASAVSAQSQSQTVRAAAASLNTDRALAPDTLIRTRFMDDVIERLCADLEAKGEKLDQLVLLGAGLDARAYRLHCLRHTSVYELDVAGVLKYKSVKLDDEAHATLLAKSMKRVTVDLGVMGDQPAASRTSQRANKRAKAVASAHTETVTPTSSPSSAPSAPQPPPWLSSLIASGFDFRSHTVDGRVRHTLWVAEGLLMYLGKHQVSNLIGWIARMARDGSGTGGGCDAVLDDKLTSKPGAVPTESSLCSSSPSSRFFTPSCLACGHHLVADIVNEDTVRSRLKWYRFFRWGCNRPTDMQSTNDHTSDSSKENGNGTNVKRQRSSSQRHDICTFARSNGWTICQQPLNCIVPGVDAQTEAVYSTSAPSPSTVPLPQAGLSPSPPSSSSRLHIHPICRDGVSYGRYLAPSMLDSSSSTPHRTQPLKIETYVILAHVMPLNRAGRSASDE